MTIFKTFLFIFLMLNANARAQDQFPFVGEVTHGPVNVRAGANTNFEVIEKLSKGDLIVVTFQSYEWYKVQLRKTAKVFVRADYIKVHDGDIGELTADKVNLRAKASSESSALGQVKKGQLVRLIAKNNDWWQIQPTDQTFGWIHSDFITLKSLEIPSELKQDVLTIAPPKPIVPVEAIVEPIVIPPIVIQGKILPLIESSSGAHYQVLVNDQPVYYLQDIPHLERFNRNIVNIEGLIVPDQISDVCPILQIKKIALVL